MLAASFSLRLLFLLFPTTQPLLSMILLLPESLQVSVGSAISGLGVCSSFVGVCLLLSLLLLLLLSPSLLFECLAFAILGTVVLHVIVSGVNKINGDRKGLI
jgi:hypothetical protein